MISDETERKSGDRLKLGGTHRLQQTLVPTLDEREISLANFPIVLLVSQGYT